LTGRESRRRMRIKIRTLARRVKWCRWGVGTDEHQQWRGSGGEREQRGGLGCLEADGEPTKGLDKDENKAYYDTDLTEYTKGCGTMDTGRLVTSLRYGKSECEHYAVGRLVQLGTCQRASPGV
jgi:hypothetical protein